MKKSKIRTYDFFQKPLRLGDICLRKVNWVCLTRFSVHFKIFFYQNYEVPTMHPRNRQDDFWITVSFFIVLFSFKVQESISDHLKIFHLALFEKNQKLTI